MYLKTNNHCILFPRCFDCCFPNTIHTITLQNKILTQPPIEETIIEDEKTARKSPPETEKENKRDKDMSLAMAPLPIPMGIGGLAGKIFVSCMQSTLCCTIALRFSFSFFSNTFKMI